MRFTDCHFAKLWRKSSNFSDFYFCVCRAVWASSSKPNCAFILLNSSSSIKGAAWESSSSLAEITFTKLFRREEKKRTILLLRYSPYIFDSFW